MAKCATESSKGFYYGYFWVWYMSAQIAGNLSGALLIKNETGMGFFIIMSAIAMVFTFGFCFLRTPHKQHGIEEQSQPKEELEHQLILKEREEKKSFVDNLKSTIKLLFSREMLSLDLNLIWGGMSIAYWSTVLTPLMTLQQPGKTEDEQLQGALFGMTAFGVGEVLGGFLHGLLIDKIGSKKTVFFNLIIIAALFVSTMMSLWQLEYNYLTFITTFLWGYQDGMTNIFLF